MTFTPSAFLVGRLVAALAERRQRLGLSQVEANMRIGWADGLLSKYEAGIRIPSIQALTWWAASLGLALGLVEQPGDPRAPPKPRAAKRATISLMLADGLSYSEIRRRTGASRATIARVSKVNRLYSRLENAGKTTRGSGSGEPHRGRKIAA